MMPRINFFCRAEVTVQILYHKFITLSSLTAKNNLKKRCLFLCILPIILIPDAKGNTARYLYGIA